MHPGLTIILIGAALLIAVILMSGCGAVSGGVSDVIKCPAILPPEPECQPCDDTAPAEYRTIEQMRATLKEIQAARLECLAKNDACFRRDRIIYNAWQDCE